MALRLSYLGGPLRKHLLASLIVCVALLTHFGASLWNATAMRADLTGCHLNVAWSSPADVERSGAPDGAPAQTPVPHDHASCSLCQLGFSIVRSDAPDIEAWVIAHRRVRLTEPHTRVPITVLNFSAPARASPFPA